MYLMWLVVIVVLTIVEILTTSLVSIWFVASGILALITSFFTDSLIVQFAVFVIVGCLLLLFTRNVVKNKLFSKSVSTNSDRVVGMIGVVTEKITKNNYGEVKVDGKKWTAMADKTINVGKEVEILKIDGVKLKVKECD